MIAPMTAWTIWVHMMLQALKVPQPQPKEQAK